MPFLMPDTTKKARRLARGILLWVVIAGLWVLLYPSIRLSRHEAALVLLSFFFFVGAQKFHQEEQDFVQSPEADLPPRLAPLRLARWWRKWRVPLFLSSGLISLALLAASRVFAIVPA